jgi:hypothetical protein
MSLSSRRRASAWLRSRGTSYSLQILLDHLAAGRFSPVPRSQEQPPLVAEPRVSVEDSAAHLGAAGDSVNRWIDAKGVPAHEIGMLSKFKLPDVDEWVRGGDANEYAGARRPSARRAKRLKKR